MREIKIGDRVTSNATGMDRRTYGKVGTVKGFSEINGSPLVEFDENISGHDGNGRCDYTGMDGHCWYLNKADLSIIETEARFKVGDRVRVRKREDIPADVPFGFVSEMAERCGTVVTIKSVHHINDRNEDCYRIEDDYEDWVWHEDMFEPEPVREGAEQKIVITTDGKTTVATLYDGEKVVKEAKADCSPEDKFDFVKGAELAFQRLTTHFRFEVGKQYRHGNSGLVIEITGAWVRECDIKRYSYKVIKGDNFGTSCEFDEDSIFGKALTPYEPPQVYNGKVVCTGSRGGVDFTVGKVYEFVNGQAKDNDGTMRPVGERIIDLKEYGAYTFIPLVE